jgi:hypothetical protein
MTSRPSISLSDLRSWEEHGATWRTLTLTDERAILELCTCYGEPVDTVQSDEPELIAFVREHRED